MLFPLLVAFVGGLLWLEVYFILLIRSSREPLREILVKMCGTHFFVFYIAYRVFLRISEYRAHPNLFTTFAHVNWGLIMMTFMLYFIGYLVRKPPVARAMDFKERVFPIFCASLSYMIYESPRWSSFAFFKPFYPFDMGHPNIVSIALLLSGNLILCMGLYRLRYAFSILIQARGLVKEGIYRYVRHPLYLGQTLTTLGACLWIPSWFNIAVTILFIPLQYLRGQLEEKKLQTIFPDYRAYKEKTGFYLPKLKL